MNWWGGFIRHQIAIVISSGGVGERVAEPADLNAVSAMLLP